MDWTTVFSETGEEELILPPPGSKAPRLSRLVSVMYHRHYHHRHHRRPSTVSATDRRHSLLGESGADDGDGFESHRLFVISADAEADEERSAASSSSSSGSYYDSASYTLGALYCLSINYILGVGCLGVPYAFARAGFVLCGLIIFAVTVMSYVTVMWVAECGARAESEASESASRRTRAGSAPAIGDASEAKKPRSDDGGVASRVQHFEVDTENASSEKTSLLQRQRLASVQPNAFDPRQYEVIDLVSFYLGPYHKALYQISLMALMYIGLLAYTQVFCGAASALLPASRRARWCVRILPQVIFGGVVVPLSCTELDEQVAVQAVMACVRFVAIFIMAGGSAAALFLDNGRNGEDGGRDDRPPYFAAPDVENCRMSYTACFSGFGVAFSTALFSQLFQHSVPGLVRPLAGQQERIAKVPLVFGASLLTTWSFYMLLGMTAASYFGAETRSSVNLNFAGFTFGLDPGTTNGWILSICRLAASVVVMFPALDTLSVFPLIANTLGNNLLATTSPAFPKWVVARMQRKDFGRFLPGSVTPTHGAEAQLPAAEEKKKVLERASRLSTVFWRLVAAFPPLIGSIWATDLSFSLLLAGVAGLYVAFFAPSLMQLASYRRASGDSHSTDNVFRGWYSRAYYAYPVLGFATFSLGVVLVQIGDAWTAMMG